MTKSWACHGRWQNHEHAANTVCRMRWPNIKMMNGTTRDGLRCSAWVTIRPPANLLPHFACIRKMQPQIYKKAHPVQLPSQAHTDYVGCMDNIWLKNYIDIDDCGAALYRLRQSPELHSVHLPTYYHISPVSVKCNYKYIKKRIPFHCRVRHTPPNYSCT